MPYNQVTPLAEAMLISKKSAFMTEYRRKGIPASQVPTEVSEPLIATVMGAPEEKLVKVSGIFKRELEPPKEAFDGFVCEECGEMTVERYGRIKGNKKVCIDCAESR